MAVRRLPANERKPVAWKNGGGVTREIAAFPDGADMDGFDWRLSMAEVASAGPFSRFDGIDRVLTVLEGELELRFDGEPATVLSSGAEPFAFAGDRACHGAPVGGAVTDFNVMVRRDVVRAEARRVDGSEPLTAAGETLILLALEPATVGGVRLERWDALVADAGETLAVEGAARLLAVDLFRL